MNIFTRLFKVKSKVTIYYDNSGEVLDAVGNIGVTRANRGAFKLLRGQINPTFGYKARRFLKRIATEISARAAIFCDEESVKAVPYIGLLEDGK